MSIVDGKNLVTWEGGLFEPGSDLLARTKWAFAQIRAQGGVIQLNEAGRPYGVPGDRFVGDSRLTESGLSTVWYQWGRYLRKETPSAANPADGIYASEHTKGIATDTNTNRLDLRARYFGLMGMDNTISSESWHWAIRRPAQLDYSEFAGSNVVPIDEEIVEPSEEEYGMSTVFRAADESGAPLIPNGWSFLQGDDGILRPLSSLEYDAHMYAHPKAIVIVWKGSDIYNLAMANGLYEWAGTEDGSQPGGLTGRLIGRTADKNNKVGSDFRHWAYGQAPVIPDPTNP